MPGVALPVRVDKIMKRVQNLTRTTSKSRTVSGGEDVTYKVLRDSTSGKTFSVFALRKSRSLCRMGSLPSDVPAGCLPVYVGSERKRFVISTKYLNHPFFKAILKRSEEEFGFNHQGGLSIACDPTMFEHLLWVIGSDNPEARKDEKLDNLLDLYAW